MSRLPHEEVSNSDFKVIENESIKAISMACNVNNVGYIETLCMASDVTLLFGNDDATPDISDMNTRKWREAQRGDPVLSELMGLVRKGQHPLTKNVSPDLVPFMREFEHFTMKR